MQFSFLITYLHPDTNASVSDTEIARVSALVKATPGMARGRIYTPQHADDFYTNDGPSPLFALQLDFETLAALEACITVDGYLQRLAKIDIPVLQACDVEQQVMARRPFPVAVSQAKLAHGALPCQFLVHYPGHAHDFDAWINYYLGHHPQIMYYFEGVREIEIFTRVDWLDAMPWRRVHYMQRNKLMFDSPEAITAAMNSPVRHQMRADFEKFPPFEGSNIHHPMAVRTYPNQAAKGGQEGQR